MRHQLKKAWRKVIYAGNSSQQAVRQVTSRRQLAFVLVDGIAWAAGLVLATLLRTDLSAANIDWQGLAWFVPLAVLTQAAWGSFSGLYRGRWRLGSFDQCAGLARTVLGVTATLFVVDQWVIRALVPRSVPLGAGLAALLFMAGTRYALRVTKERERRPADEPLERVLVFGAGDGGARVISAILREPTCPYVPAGLLDDDPAKRNLRIMGVPVVGGRAQLLQAATDLRATTLVIAAPSVSSSLLGDLSGPAASAGLTIKVLPKFSDLFGNSITAGDIRDVRPEDLLGRQPIETDISSIAGYLTGKRVLVTGAGGSIGSELCRQIYRFAPAELVMLDRDESALHAVQLSIYGRALLDTDELVLLDIRDPLAVDRLFADRRPEVVFHAAALKHLPMLERYPSEALKTNVLATLDLLETAARYQVDRFINISTDKAADPVSVLGYSKRIAERLTGWFADQHRDSTWLSVRFANVLGSRGSVLTAFQAQIETGGPLTVTDPEVTRYIMMIDEAVELVIQAGAIGVTGDVLVLDTGEPVRIADLARILITRARRPIDIVFTGLRPGEKLHEVLFGSEESPTRTVHPLIAHVPVPKFDPARLGEFGAPVDGERLIARFRALALDGALQPVNGGPGPSGAS